MRGRWTLTVREGSRVEHMHFQTLGASVEAMERKLDELAPNARRRSIEIVGRRFDAARQVAVRAEIAGPAGLLGGPRGGVDMRGDGSAEAYVGRLRRTLVEPEPGETPYDALRRALQAKLPSGTA